MLLGLHQPLGQGGPVVDGVRLPVGQDGREDGEGSSGHDGVVAGSLLEKSSSCNSGCP